ncbi:MAG: hydrogenase maturation peptidase HycI [Anaerolineae bacterium]
MPDPESDAWQHSLREAMQYPAARGGSLRVSVLGIGNELQGDDAAGVLTARALGARIGTNPGFQVLEAGTAPESFSGSLRRYQPDLVLLVDAVQMGTSPGNTSWLAAEQCDGFSASTHTLPLSMLAAYLTSELSCRVALIGIQAAHLEFGQPLSKPVEQAVNRLVDALADTIAADTPQH